MVSLIRHRFGLSEDRDAALFQKDMLAVNDVENYIMSRIMDIRNRSNVEMQDESEAILQEMREFWDEWESRVNLSENGNFFYGDRFIVANPPTDAKRLLKVYGSDSFDPARETLTSMRNVDRNVIAGLLVWE